MSVTETIDRSARANDAARRERLASPDVIQKGRAVRHPMGAGIRLAKTTESATANDHITCNLLDYDGVEITEGEGAGIEVYCSISNGTALNTSAPRLEDDQVIPVAYICNNWWCTGVFNGSDDCVCTPPE